MLLRNKEVFQLWSRLGLKIMFIGIEAIDEEGLQEVPQARELLEELRGARVRAHASASTSRSTSSPTPTGTASASASSASGAREIPEVVNISVNTPYPGTETWLTEARKLTTRDYRLFDIQHAVLPTTLPLPEFYEELVATQQVLNRKHLGARQIWGAAKNVARAARAGADELPQDALQVQQRLRPEAAARRPRAAGRLRDVAAARRRRSAVDPTTLYVHRAAGRRGREIDDGDRALRRRDAHGRRRLRTSPGSASGVTVRTRSRRRAARRGAAGRARCSRRSRARRPPRDSPLRATAGRRRASTAPSSARR